MTNVLEIPPTISHHNKFIPLIVGKLFTIIKESNTKIVLTKSNQPYYNNYTYSLNQDDPYCQLKSGFNCFEVTPNGYIKYLAPLQNHDQKLSQEKDACYTNIDEKAIHQDMSYKDVYKIKLGYLEIIQEDMKKPISKYEKQNKVLQNSILEKLIENSQDCQVLANSTAKIVDVFHVTGSSEPASVKKYCNCKYSKLAYLVDHNPTTNEINCRGAYSITTEPNPRFSVQAISQNENVMIECGCPFDKCIYKIKVSSHLKINPSVISSISHKKIYIKKAYDYSCMYCKSASENYRIRELLVPKTFLPDQDLTELNQTFGQLQYGGKMLLEYAVKLVELKNSKSTYFETGYTINSTYQNDYNQLKMVQPCSYNEYIAFRLSNWPLDKLIRKMCTNEQVKDIPSSNKRILSDDGDSGSFEQNPENMNGLFYHVVQLSYEKDLNEIFRENLLEFNNGDHSNETMVDFSAIGEDGELVYTNTLKMKNSKLEALQKNFDTKIDLLIHALQILSNKIRNRVPYQPKNGSIPDVNLDIEGNGSTTPQDGNYPLDEELLPDGQTLTKTNTDKKVVTGDLIAIIIILALMINWVIPTIFCGACVCYDYRFGSDAQKSNIQYLMRCYWMFGLISPMLFVIYLCCCRRRLLHLYMKSRETAINSDQLESDIKPVNQVDFEGDDISCEIEEKNQKQQKVNMTYTSNSYRARFGMNQQDFDKKPIIELQDEEDNMEELKKLLFKKFMMRKSLLMEAGLLKQLAEYGEIEVGNYCELEKQVDQQIHNEIQNDINGDISEMKFSFPDNNSEGITDESSSVTTKTKSIINDDKSIEDCLLKTDLQTEINNDYEKSVKYDFGDDIGVLKEWEGFMQENIMDKKENYKEKEKDDQFIDQSSHDCQKSNQAVPKDLVNDKKGKSFETSPEITNTEETEFENLMSLTGEFQKKPSSQIVTSEEFQNLNDTELLIEPGQENQNESNETIKPKKQSRRNSKGSQKKIEKSSGSYTKMTKILDSGVQKT